MSFFDGRILYGKTFGEELDLAAGVANNVMSIRSSHTHTFTYNAPFPFLEVQVKATAASCHIIYVDCIFQKVWNVNIKNSG